MEVAKAIIAPVFSNFSFIFLRFFAYFFKGTYCQRKQKHMAQDYFIEHHTVYEVHMLITLRSISLDGKIYVS